MGIGGQGISAVAQMVLEARGKIVVISGCDMQASATTRALQDIGVPVEIGHSPDHLLGIDKLVVVPAALVLNPDHPELVTAQARGIPMITWQEMLGELMREKFAISVSGVHGKGTTTAMLSLILVDAGLDPTCEVGAIVPRFGVNYRLGKSQYFVNEADEFYNNFWNYHPRVALVTSIEFEHPEFFADYAAFLNAFEQFVRGMDMDSDWPIPPTLILNANSPGCLELVARLQDWRGQVVMYAVEGLPVSQKDIARAVITFEAYDVKLEGETSFCVRAQSPQGTLGTLGNGESQRVRLQLPGTHNVQNALAALTAATVVGIDADTVVRTLEDFTGIRRRFEIRNQGPIQVNGQPMDVILVDDYAHHPTAIAATLEAAHRRYPGRRLVAVYQPHMFSRTKTFFEQFLHAFDLAGVVIIADIFPARERDTGLISSRELVEAMAKQPHFQQPEILSAAKDDMAVEAMARQPHFQHGGQVLHGGSVQATTQLLRSLLRPNDLVLVMGAGDIYTLTDVVLEDRSLDEGKRL